MNPVTWADLAVGVAAVAALAYVVKSFMGYLSNHTDHQTEALGELREAIRELISFLKRN